MDAFLELGKRSLPPSSDVLRGFFDASLDRGKPASALKGKCKTCHHRIILRQDRMCARYHGCADSNKCLNPPPEAVEIVQQHYVLISYVPTSRAMCYRFCSFAFESIFFLISRRICRKHVKFTVSWPSLVSYQCLHAYTAKYLSLIHI